MKELVVSQWDAICDELSAGGGIKMLTKEVPPKAALPRAGGLGSPKARRVHLVVNVQGTDAAVTSARKSVRTRTLFARLPWFYTPSCRLAQVLLCRAWRCSAWLMCVCRMFTSLAKSLIVHKVTVPPSKVTRALIAAVRSLRQQLLGGGGKDDDGSAGAGGGGADDDGDRLGYGPSYDHTFSRAAPLLQSVLVKVHDSLDKQKPSGTDWCEVFITTRAKFKSVADKWKQQFEELHRSFVEETIALPDTFQFTTGDRRKVEADFDVRLMVRSL
jgi:hypothetical protein